MHLSTGSVRRALDRRWAVCWAALPFLATSVWGDVAYVTCQNGEALAAIDLDTGQIAAPWSLPGQPAGVAAAASGYVYTVAPEAKSVRKHDAQSGAVLAEIILDGGPTGIAHDPLGARVFVSDWYNARIWVLSDDLQAIQTLSVGAAPAGLDVSDDGRYLASADRDAHQVSIFDLEDLSLHHRIPVGERPYGLRFSDDGRLFVGNVGSNNVTVLAPNTGTVLATVPVGERPYGITFSQGRAFVTNQYDSTISVFDMTSYEAVATIETAEYPEGIDTAANGAVVVANWFDNLVQVIDPTTLEITSSFDTPDGPRAFGRFIAPD